MFSVDMSTGQVRASAGLLEIWGLADGDESLRYDDLLQSVHPSDRMRCNEVRANALLKKQTYHSQYRVVRRDGSVRTIRGEGKFIFDDQGRPTFNQGAAVDVTALVAAENKTLHLLEHDPLTGLLSRNAFVERLQRAVLHHRPGEIFGVLVFDLDRFTSLNDTLGSSTGDIVLCSFATKLRMLESDGHVVGRVGGDEFACLLLGQPDEEALLRTVVSVRSLIREPICIVGTSMHVSTSSGLAAYAVDGEDISLLERAHLACCKAKSEGQNGFSRYNVSMESEMSQQYKLEVSLHSAIANGVLQVYYQPIVDATHLDIVGVEALVRWDHPLLGLLTPDAFLPIATTIGIAPLIDAWVLIRACLDGAVAWRRTGTLLKVHVNVCAGTLARPDFVQSVQAALESSGFLASALVLEMTEQSLIEDVAEVAGKFALIRSMGAKVAIDDFGTGYNGLRYLKEYSVDSIKIDRTFISDVETSPYSRGVCSGIMALARNLDLGVVAEGVETLEQADFLRELGVEAFQGYLYGRPTLLGEVLDRLRQDTIA